MYLSELHITNFRKFGQNGDGPGVKIIFQEGLNVLIGENDSGKTSIIDAIRFTLGTQSNEWQRLEESDFHFAEDKRAERLEIKCIFKGINDSEASRFLEWLTLVQDETNAFNYFLNLKLVATRRSDNRIITDVRAGNDDIGVQLDAEARELLRVTYLKPLRDSKSELTPGRKSRLAQILKSHSIFQKKSDEEDHELEVIAKEANEKIKDYFSAEEVNSQQEPGTEETSPNGSELLSQVNSYLEQFFPETDEVKASIDIGGTELIEILKRLELAFEGESSGLGSSNLLYIAAELLLLQSSDFFGLRLALVEELEAHLHPQAQLCLTNFLEQESEDSGQFILSTHSTTLGASIDLKKMILCKDGKAFPMGPTFTCLEEKNYGFLSRFLDATKANLFFARGVILVEGDAENILLPSIAKIIDRPLHKYGVSIVNIGSTAFLHYAKIFARRDGSSLGIPVALLTDLDAKPLEYVDENGNQQNQENIDKVREDKETWVENYNNDITLCFVSPNWTLEYELALSKLRKRFYRMILWAQKIENAKTGIPQDKKSNEVKEQRDSDFDSWNEEYKDDPRVKEKIAYEIYKNKMLDSKISKAITAQVFADSLLKEFSKDKQTVVDNFKNSPSLKYILDAIYHVTKPSEVVADD